MSGALIVRSAAPADFPQWSPLWEGYNSFYERKIPAEVTQMTWSRFFDAYEPVHAMVAEKDGRLVGLVHYLFHRNTAMIGPTCYLQDLFASKAARGAGIGRALIEAVYARARIAGSPRVYWMTHETNATAMKLYDKVAERSASSSTASRFDLRGSAGFTPENNLRRIRSNRESARQPSPWKAGQTSRFKTA